MTFTEGQSGTATLSATFPAKDDDITLRGYKSGFLRIEWNGENAYVLADNVNAEFTAPIEGAATRKLTEYSCMSTKLKYKAGTLAKGESVTSPADTASGGG